MSETQTQDADDADYPDEQAHAPTDGEADTPFRTTPTVRPTLIWIAVTVLAVAASIAVIVANQQLLGGPNMVEIAVQVVAVIGALIVLRLAIRILILMRTTYEVDEQRVSRKYALLLRSSERDVPIEFIRSSHLQQNRVQSLLGYGDITINEDLGAISLENVPDPHQLQSLIADYRFDESDST